MTQEKIDKAKKLQEEIEKYDKVIRYAKTEGLTFIGMIGKVELLNDKELAKLVYEYCKDKKSKLIKEFEEL